MIPILLLIYLSGVGLSILIIGYENDKAVKKSKQSKLKDVELTSASVAIYSYLFLFLFITSSLKEFLTDSKPSLKGILSFFHRKKLQDEI